MAKKTTPIITHTEILSRAIRSIEDDIAECRRRCEELPQHLRAQMLDASTKELVVKLTALRSLYLMETGVEWERET